MRQQLSQAAVGPGGEFAEDVFEVGRGVVAIELGRFDQAHQDGGPFSGLLGADESSQPRGISRLAPLEKSVTFSFIERLGKMG
jgi:hypothetical protein